MCPQYTDAPAVGYLTTKLQNSTWYKCLNLSLTGSRTYIQTFIQKDVHSYAHMHVPTYACTENWKTFWYIFKYFAHFSLPIRLDMFCKQACMKCKTLFSEKKKKIPSICHPLNSSAMCKKLNYIFKQWSQKPACTFIAQDNRAQLFKTLLA